MGTFGVEIKVEIKIIRNVHIRYIIFYNLLHCVDYIYARLSTNVSVLLCKKGELSYTVSFGRTYLLCRYN